MDSDSDYFSDVNEENTQKEIKTKSFDEWLLANSKISFPSFNFDMYQYDEDGNPIEIEEEKKEEISEEEKIEVTPLRKLAGINK